MNKDSRSSFRVGKPLIYSWQNSNEKESYVANAFYSENNICLFHRNYIQPQLLSSHVNLGIGTGTCQNSIDFHLENNGTLVKKAFWVCTCIIIGVKVHVKNLF